MKIPLLLTAPDRCKVFTPPELAGPMATVLTDFPGCQWLEPCVGKGVFLNALAEAGVDPTRITAVELDRHELAVKCGEYHSGTDFLAWALATDARFDRIIGNPPYLKLHRAHQEVIRSAMRVARPGGGTVPLRANCWYAFLCACLRLLKPGGGMCLVLPAGWDYADYAADLRDMLPSMFSRFEIVRGARSFFRGILDGCIVLVADGFGKPPSTPRRFEYPSLQAVVAHLLNPAITKDDPVGPAQSPPSDTQALVPFGAIARVRIGAVSGDAKYFLMDESRRKELGIDQKYVRPVLTRARQLTKPDVTMADWRTLRDAGERVWLFWPSHRPGRRPKAIVEYLAAGIQRKTHLGQKTRNREHWYLTNVNPPCDGFMSGMSSTGPWLCLNHSSDLTATNTLYTVHFRRRMPRYEMAAWALSLVSRTTAEQYRSIGRYYSKGLLKFEPQDVMDLLIRPPVNRSAQSVMVYHAVMARFLKGEVDKARELAEAFVVNGLVPSSRSIR